MPYAHSGLRRAISPKLAVSEAKSGQVCAGPVCDPIDCHPHFPNAGRPPLAPLKRLAPPGRTETALALRICDRNDLGNGSGQSGHRDGTRLPHLAARILQESCRE